MSDLSATTTGSESLIQLPVQPPRAQAAESPLVERLVTQHDATWVDEANIKAWADRAGDHVLLFAGDAVRFPEGQDVAVVLPELQRSASRPFDIGVVPRQKEEALARKYGSNRWPTLVFLRDGQYVTTVSGMRDWDDYVVAVEQALTAPVSRAPSIGIPVVNGDASPSTCH